tara:strand:- start:3093 stop:3200 length:108 start_codon:yes stop_codon:yes gene_type:complete
MKKVKKGIATSGMPDRTNVKNKSEVIMIELKKVGK